MGRRIASYVGCALWLSVLGCDSERVVVGEQCPAAGTPESSVQGVRNPSEIYGTSCAPCSDRALKLDAQGCPRYVTWASCGGDICIGSRLIPRSPLDAGPRDGGDEDAGDEHDEDSGAD